jgi:ABC-type uncharacterized transport system permease subunit
MGLGWPQSKRVIADAQLPRLIQGKRLHFGFVIAIASAVIMWVVMKKTTLGYEMRAVGNNAEAARFAGIPVNRVLMKTALLSGGLAALAGFSEVAGLKGNLTLDLSPGFGYTGIVVAMLAMLNPLGVVASAIFVAGIFVGADAMSRAAGVPSYIAQVMVATALLTMVTAIMLTATGSSGGDDGSLRDPADDELLGGGNTHRLAADLRDDGRTDLRTGRRAQSRHRGNHDGRRVRRLDHGLCGRRLVDRASRSRR